MKQLTFSIITCTWNSATYLPQSIESVLSQNYPHIEYIFVDGGSTDGTLEQIRSLKRPYRLIENIGGGISRAMNEGIRHATGDVIAHLHSDDYYLHGNVLSTVADHLNSSGREWLFGRIERDIDGILHEENFVAPRFSVPHLLGRNFIPHPATFVRRQLLNRTHGFDSHLKYAMDYDLWLRLAQLALPVQLDEALTAFRVHQGSVSSSNQLAAMEEDFRVRLAHANRNPVTRAVHYTRYLRRRHQLSQAGVTL